MHSIFCRVDDKHVPLYRVIWISDVPHFCGEDDCLCEGRYEVRLEQGESVWANREERDAIDSVMRMLRGGAFSAGRADVKLYRKRPDGQLEYCAKYSPEEFLEGGHDLIREQWGPGRYQVILYATNEAGKNYARRAMNEVNIAQPPAVAAKPANESDRVLSLLERMDSRIAQLETSKPDPMAPDDVWNAGFDLKFTTVRRLTNAFLPDMRASGWGRIINVTGLIEPLATSAALTACAAVHAWAKGLSRDLAKDGITVNCVPPGRIDSEQIRERLHPDPVAKQRYIDQFIPMGRFGEPEELADLVTFLASPRAGYITGTVIPVDGGMSRFAM